MYCIVLFYTFIQCELYHWIDVLDRFDGILEEASKHEQDSPTDCIFMCPKLLEPQVKAVHSACTHFKDGLGLQGFGHVYMHNDTLGFVH